MQTTPLETWELYRYLLEAGRLTAELRTRLQETVRRYRLDAPPLGDGRRTFSRRTYTCPFFMKERLGCSIAPEAKPYGCLGFNARRSGVTEGGDCASDQALLAAREAEHGDFEAQRNQEISTKYGLDWEKRPMPWALLTLWQLEEGLP